MNGFPFQCVELRGRSATITDVLKICLLQQIPSPLPISVYVRQSFGHSLSLDENTTTEYLPFESTTKQGKTIYSG